MVERQREKIRAREDKQTENTAGTELVPYPPEEMYVEERRGEERQNKSIQSPILLGSN